MKQTVLATDFSARLITFFIDQQLPQLLSADGVPVKVFPEWLKAKDRTPLASLSRLTRRQNYSQLSLLPERRACTRLNVFTLTYTFEKLNDSINEYGKNNAV